MTRFGCGDRHFEFELVVAELLDAVSAVDEWPSGAFVVLASHVTPHLTMARLVGVVLIYGRTVSQRRSRRVLVGETLGSPFDERILEFGELEAQPSKDAIGLLELDLVVAADLDAICRLSPGCPRMTAGPAG